MNSARPSLCLFGNETIVHPAVAAFLFYETVFNTHCAGSEEPISRTVTPIEEKLPIVPNYLQNPPFPYYEVNPDKALCVSNGSQRRAASECHGHSQDTKLVAKMEALAVAHSECGSSVSTFEKLPNKEIHDQEANSPSSFSSSPFVVKVCVGGSGDSDFVEVEVPSMTYPALLMACCEELDIPTSDVVKIRKLPNVWVRKDRDVQRMREGQELEIILKSGADGGDGGGVKTDSPR